MTIKDYAIDNFNATIARSNSSQAFVQFWSEDHSIEELISIMDSSNEDPFMGFETQTLFFDDINKAKKFAIVITNNKVKAIVYNIKFCESSI